MGLSSMGQLVVEKIRYISVRHSNARIDEYGRLIPTKPTRIQI